MYYLLRNVILQCFSSWFHRLSVLRLPHFTCRPRCCKKIQELQALYHPPRKWLLFIT